MSIILKPLPYDYDALEPFIDTLTMQIHHDKHHAAYVNNLNAALEKYPVLNSRSLEELLTDLHSVPDEVRPVVRNHGGGTWNHDFFWSSMTPAAGGAPNGELIQAIDQSFGGQDEFKAEFEKASNGRFGSGWAWLVKGKTRLEIISTPNQDNPINDGLIPILGLDVWEHAYYLKYQNRRAEYVKAWWNVVNWDEVSRRYKVG